MISPMACIVSCSLSIAVQYACSVALQWLPLALSHWSKCVSHINAVRDSKKVDDAAILFPLLRKNRLSNATLIFSVSFPSTRNHALTIKQWNKDKSNRNSYR